MNSNNNPKNLSTPKRKKKPRNNPEAALQRQQQPRRSTRRRFRDGIEQEPPQEQDQQEPVFLPQSQQQIEDRDQEQQQYQQQTFPTIPDITPYLDVETKSPQDFYEYLEDSENLEKALNYFIGIRNEAIYFRTRSEHQFLQFSSFPNLNVSKSHLCFYLIESRLRLARTCSDFRLLSDQIEVFEEVKRHHHKNFITSNHNRSNSNNTDESAVITTKTVLMKKEEDLEEKVVFAQNEELPAKEKGNEDLNNNNNILEGGGREENYDDKVVVGVLEKEGGVFSIGQQKNQQIEEAEEEQEDLGQEQAPPQPSLALPVRSLRLPVDPIIEEARESAEDYDDSQLPNDQPRMQHQNQQRRSDNKKNNISLSSNNKQYSEEEEEMVFEKLVPNSNNNEEEVEAEENDSLLLSGIANVEELRGLLDADGDQIVHDLEGILEKDFVRKYLPPPTDDDLRRKKKSVHDDPSPTSQQQPSANLNRPPAQPLEQDEGADEEALVRCARGFRRVFRLFMRPDVQFSLVSAVVFQLNQLTCLTKKSGWSKLMMLKREIDREFHSILKFGLYNNLIKREDMHLFLSTVECFNFWQKAIANAQQLKMDLYGGGGGMVNNHNNQNSAADQKLLKKDNESYQPWLVLLKKSLLAVRNREKVLHDEKSHQFLQRCKLSIIQWLFNSEFSLIWWVMQFLFRDFIPSDETKRQFLYLRGAANTGKSFFTEMLFRSKKFLKRNMSMSFFAPFSKGDYRLHALIFDDPGRADGRQNKLNTDFFLQAAKASGTGVNSPIFIEKKRNYSKMKDQQSLLSSNNNNNNNSFPHPSNEEDDEEDDDQRKKVQNHDSCSSNALSFPIKYGHMRVLSGQICLVSNHGPEKMFEQAKLSPMLTRLHVINFDETGEFPLQSRTNRATAHFPRPLRRIRRDEEEEEQAGENQLLVFPNSVDGDFAGDDKRRNNKNNSSTVFMIPRREKQLSIDQHSQGHHNHSYGRLPKNQYNNNKYSANNIFLTCWNKFYRNRIARWVSGTKRAEIAAGFMFYKSIVVDGDDNEFDDDNHTHQQLLDVENDQKNQAKKMKKQRINNSDNNNNLMMMIEEEEPAQENAEAEVLQEKRDQEILMAEEVEDEERIIENDEKNENRIIEEEDEGVNKGNEQDQGRNFYDDGDDKRNKNNAMMMLEEDHHEEEEEHEREKSISSQLPQSRLNDQGEEEVEAFFAEEKISKGSEQKEQDKKSPANIIFKRTSISEPLLVKKTIEKLDKKQNIKKNKKDNKNIVMIEEQGDEILLLSTPKEIREAKALLRSTKKERETRRSLKEAERKKRNQQKPPRPGLFFSSRNNSNFIINNDYYASSSNNSSSRNDDQSSQQQRRKNYYQNRQAHQDLSFSESLRMYETSIRDSAPIPVEKIEDSRLSMNVMYFLLWTSIFDVMQEVIFTNEEGKNTEFLTRMVPNRTFRDMLIMASRQGIPMLELLEDLTSRQEDDFDKDEELRKYLYSSETDLEAEDYDF